MTRVDPGRPFFCPVFGLVFGLILLVSGCDDRVSVFPEPRTPQEGVRVLRRSDYGPIVISFASYPLRDGVPPDGVAFAVLRAAGGYPVSAAVFYWSERGRAERWLEEQMAVRRSLGQPIRLIFAGHGLGATEAAEATRGLLLRTPDAEVALLLTVDAVKPGKVERAAAITGSALFNLGGMPGVKIGLTAYDSAPAPDGRRFWTHINYYQNQSLFYHGSSMPWAENHHIDDWTGLLNHGNADDFVFPLLLADIKAALERGSR
ncbi:MAG: hypothetical protein FWG74_04805 [Planctomycetes bacterium]|nr:hypothetical protein [Planctomycetota bacterium]